MAVKAGAKAIYVSNHGARQLDTSLLPLETLMEMRTYAPEIFDQVTVFADGGVRYGTDVLKLLALGVHAVGIARPFMFANVYGLEGVEKLIDILKRELWVDMANLGVKDLSELNTTYVSLLCFKSLSQLLMTTLDKHSKARAIHLRDVDALGCRYWK